MGTDVETDLTTLNRVQIAVLIFSAVGMIVATYRWTDPVLSYETMSYFEMGSDEYNAVSLILLENQGFRSATEVQVTVTLLNGHFAEFGPVYISDATTYSHPIEGCVPTDNHACVPDEPYIIFFTNTIAMYFPMFPAGKSKQIEAKAQVGVPGTASLHVEGQSSEVPLRENNNALKQEVTLNKVLLGGSMLGIVVAVFWRSPKKRPVRQRARANRNA
jgi:hypothetical protein